MSLSHYLVTIVQARTKTAIIYEMSLLTIKILKLKKIQLIFLEKGHTQNANDSMHSKIEQAKWRINIFHPYQWEAVMQLSC